jgi:hypothetical protein
LEREKYILTRFMERKPLLSMETETPILSGLSMCERHWGINTYAKIEMSLRREAIGALKKLGWWEELKETYSVCRLPYDPPCGAKNVGCFQHAFEAVHDEFRGYTDTLEFRYRTGSDLVGYMRSRGYLIAYKPQRWDLIAYLAQNDIKEPVICHLGIIESGQRVISKWGESCLFSHALADIPNEYGEESLLFRNSYL